MLNDIIFILLKKEVDFLLITSNDVLNTIGEKIKRARRKKSYTQEYLAEQIDISIDLLRGIENGRNIGSLPTLLNLCNHLEISPNDLFSELLTFKPKTIDTELTDLFSNLSNKSKKTLKDIIIHIDEKY